MSPIVVITMTNCPPRLRGDLSKWLCEINTGVYVGNVSGRVRDALWNRVCQNLKNGQATMVFNAAGEQKMDFRTHNTVWKAVDFDGIKLMRRPVAEAEVEDISLKPGFSKMAKRQCAERTAKTSKTRQDPEKNYTVIDLETTGLKTEEDQIIEYGALRIRDGRMEKSFSALVRISKKLPSNITELTGIQDADLLHGMEPQQAFQSFLDFIGKDILLGQYISFDMDFLRKECEKWGKAFPTNKCLDLSKLARRKLRRVENYKLLTMLQHFGISDKVAHRALADCESIYQVYCKLNENAIE